MHIKITKWISSESKERWELDANYLKTHGSTEEIVVPINTITLSKVVVNSPIEYIYDTTKYQVFIQFNGSNRTLLVDEAEYNRIEGLLSFNNKKELEIVKNSYPSTNVRQAIQDLQLNEE